MMNKRRTKEIGRTKYLMFLPLAALLMIISNIEVVARTTKEFAKEMMAAPEEQGVSNRTRQWSGTSRWNDGSSDITG